MYSHVTDKIIADLEQGVRPWMKPWNAEHAAGRITKPLRHNGQAYNGINILMLWSAAVTEGYCAPIWMTFRQARELGANIRKGEKGELVVYANTITRTEHDDKTGEESEHTIPFMRGYTVFNVEQIEGLPSHFYQLAEPVLDPVERIDHAERFFGATGAKIGHGGNQAYYAIGSDRIQLPPFESFRDADSYYATLAHETRTGHAIHRASTGISVASVGAMKATLRKNWLPSWVRPSYPQISELRPRSEPTTPLTLKAGLRS